MMLEIFKFIRKNLENQKLSNLWSNINQTYFHTYHFYFYFGIHRAMQVGKK